MVVLVYFTFRFPNRFKFSDDQESRTHFENTIQLNLTIRLRDCPLSVILS